MDVTDQEARRRGLGATADHRAARTRERLTDALGDLLSSEQDVSVSAVCAAAGVGRSTFYTHFADIGDIVVRVVDGIFDDIGRRDVARRSERSMGRRLITETGIAELLRALRLRREFFVYALSAPATERLRERLIEDAAVGLGQSIRAERPDATAEFIGAASNFLAGGIIGILQGWVVADAEPDAEVTAKAIIELLPAWLTADDDAARAVAPGDAAE
ncbi:TetR/AcrR family transcriptional regulator [Microbacterium arborescens]|uniref:TetR/AcrR family transcriptional regulator n=1 Tax=Microbacterium arborescens TaxID=33883 RepID=UPI003C773F9E